MKIYVGVGLVMMIGDNRGFELFGSQDMYLGFMVTKRAIDRDEL